MGAFDSPRVAGAVVVNLMEVDRSCAFDWRAVPLSGRQLIEASAGTGKTFTITLLVLRALLETACGIEHIVITTFTRAAAQELKLKLRARLEQAAGLLTTPTDVLPAPEADAATLQLRQYLDQRAFALGADETRRRLRAALLSLELAPIDTLHALCARILRDEPLAAPLAIAGEPLDAHALARESLEDGWRARVLAGGAAESPDCTLLLPFGFAAVASALVPLIEGGPVEFVPAAEGLAVRRAARFDALRNPSSLDALRAVLRDADKHFCLNKDFRDGLADLIAALAVATSNPTVAAALRSEHAGKAQHKSRHKRGVEEVPAMRGVRELADGEVECQRAARAHALQALTASCRDEMRRRGRARDGHTFADLIEATAAALSGGDGDALAGRLRARWPIALIDEFQDTDAQQYAICARIWDAPDAALLLIGDPKQAIYAFRGADLHAYLAVAAALQEPPYRLGVNQRSSTPLVTATNAFYVDAGARPFALAQLAFEPVTASGRADTKPLRSDAGGEYPPLRLHIAPSDLEDASRDGHDRWCLTRCADDIGAALAPGGPKLAGKPLDPGNFAVLLPTHRHIAALRELLRARGVPCVGAGGASVYDSPAAEVLITLLGALIAPNDPALWRGVLASALYAATLSDFARWWQRPEEWALELAHAEQLAARWHTHGIAALLGPLITERAACLAAAPDGDRLLTDLRHLLELLAREEPAHAGPRALLTHLERARDDNPNMATADERSLRIDSDSARVRLLTLHASKGLEFDIVYLPLAWRLGLPEWKRTEPCVLAFHDDQGVWMRDAGSAAFDRHATRARAESQAESLRLLYVAMTRARHATHLFWAVSGTPRDSLESTALDLHLDALARRYGVPAGAPAWQAFAAAHAAVVAIAPAPSAMAQRWQPQHVSVDAAKALAVRSARPRRMQRWAVHSFTSVLRERERSFAIAATAPAGDEAWEPVDAGVFGSVAEAATAADRFDVIAPETVAAASRWRAWHGASFGNALHFSLERVDWNEPLAAQTETLQLALRESGVPALALPALRALVERTLVTPLLDGGARLRMLPPSDRLAELRFDLALQHAQLARWPALFAAHGCAHLLPSLPTSSALLGLLTGAIDLVLRHDGRYFVADYKSNDLGDGVDAYRGANLLRAMQRGQYGLQLTLYQLALHRYLRQRLHGYDYDLHCGGALYLFVRGLEADGGGVFRERLPRALVEALDADCAGASVT